MRPFDEALDADGRPRPGYAEVMAALDDLGPGRLAREAADRARAAGLAVGTRPLAVDPVPRIICAHEWETVAAGLVQRARALDALVAAAYVPGADVAPPHTPYFERDLVGVPAAGVALGIVGFDLIRGPDGVLRVLEDNVLTPGHTAIAVARELNPLAGRVRASPLPTHAIARGALLAMLGGGEGAAILGDDPPSWELRWLGRTLGVPVVSTAGLQATARGVRLRADGRPLAVLWQRTAEDRLRDDAGGLTHLGEALLEPLRTGTVRVVNRIGSGVVHDKRALAVVASAMDGPPLLGAVPTLVLDRAEDRAALLADVGAHVVKPATGGGGRGIRFGCDLVAGDVKALLAREPHAWVAQPVVPLSVHPTVAGSRLVRRPVDLRAFAVHTGAGYEVLPGGVSRYPTRPSSRIVNTSAGGGIKDVWVMPPADARARGRRAAGAAVSPPSALGWSGRRAAHVV